MLDHRLRILVIGGTGFFGGNLVRLLADEPRLTLLVAGRTECKARVFCDALPAHAETIPVAFDRNHEDIAARMRDLAPDLVIDASGPFQDYGQDYGQDYCQGTGGDPYRVARAAIEAGADYLDLADATAFVTGIGVLDADARHRGRFALSGASTCPALTAAVVRRMSAGMAQVDTITGGIAPSPFADVGLAVVRAIASYAGQPVPLRRDGQPATGTGLAETMRFDIGPPGALPLGNIRFSLVDVPELQVLPGLWPGLRTIWMGAGTRPEILHRAMNGMALLTRWGLLPALSPFASLFHAVMRRVRWGTHRGGMFVQVTGRMADGAARTRTWHMIAEGGDGPLIPSMACAGIVRRLLDGRRPAPGARPATDDLDLADFEALFTGRAIVSGVREEWTGAIDARPLYARVLGSAWDRLPEPIRRLHGLDAGPSGAMTAHGTATVECGGGLLARLVAGIVGFPAAGSEIPVQVHFTQATAPDGRPAELWTRTFAGKSFSSLQWAGTGRSEHLIVERFGPVTIGLAAVVDGQRLRIVPHRFSILGLPLPRALLPTGDTYEHVDDRGRFVFHVEIRLPLAGLVVRYRGHLTPRP